MGSDNELIDLGRLIEDSLENLNRACELAIRLVGAEPESHYPGWPAMSALVDKLGAINRLLVDLPGDEIAEAIKQADAVLEDWGDRADGQSY